MKKRTRILLIAIVSLVFCGLVLVLFLSHEPPEPVYEGKPLRVWVNQYGTNHWTRHREGKLDKQAQTAIRHIGTNAIPVYLKMLSSRTSSFKSNILGRIPQTWSKRLHIPSPNEYELEVDSTRTLGAYGLIALGPDAKPAVPALILLLNDTNDRVRYLSVFTIRCLGPVARGALPAMIKCVNDRDFTVRCDAITALGTIQAEPDHVIPILIDCLETNRRDAILRYEAIDALGQFGPQAASAVPGILRSLKDPDPGVHQQALLALGKIHAQPDLVVPALTANLAPEREKMLNDFLITLGSLEDYGPNARPAVPSILKFLNDPNADVRFVATNAIKSIDPDAATKAGIK